jgi:hypothetical protein
MSIVTTLRCWWKATVHASRTGDEVETEAQFHIDNFAADGMRSGMPEILCLSIIRATATLSINLRDLCRVLRRAYASPGRPSLGE